MALNRLTRAILAMAGRPRRINVMIETYPSRNRISLQAFVRTQTDALYVFGHLNNTAAAAITEASFDRLCALKLRRQS